MKVQQKGFSIQCKTKSLDVNVVHFEEELYP